MKNKNKQHFSRFTDKGPSVAERVSGTIRNLLKKPVFEKRKSNWTSELPSVDKEYNNTNQHSTKMTPIHASQKSNENVVYSNLQDRRVKQKPKFKLRQLVRTPDIKRVSSKGDKTNCSYILYTITEVIHVTISPYRINFLPEIHNGNQLFPTKLSLEQNNQGMRELNSIQ